MSQRWVGVFILILGFMFTMAAHAAPLAVSQNPELKISEIRVEEIPTGSWEMVDPKFPKATTRMFAKGSESKSDESKSTEEKLKEKAEQADGYSSEILAPLNLVQKVLDKIINIGKTVFNVVEKGKPVVNTQFDIGTALPEGTKSWNDLEGWQTPQAKTFNVTYYNLPGFKVVDFKYRVIYLTGGSVGGVGKYIAYATVQPADLQVGWQYDLSAQAKIERVYNKGTKKDPIAAMLITFTYTVKIVTHYVQKSETYEITGDGQFRKIE